ncbi:MAG: hypothetical protein ACLRTD_10455 [Bacteroides sp.]
MVGLLTIFSQIASVCRTAFPHSFGNREKSYMKTTTRIWFNVGDQLCHVLVTILPGTHNYGILPALRCCG